MNYIEKLQAQAIVNSIPEPEREEMVGQLSRCVGSRRGKRAVPASDVKPLENKSSRNDWSAEKSSGKAAQRRLRQQNK